MCLKKWLPLLAPNIPLNNCEYKEKFRNVNTSKLILFQRRNTYCGVTYFLGMLVCIGDHNNDNDNDDIYVCFSQKRSQISIIEF